MKVRLDECVDPKARQFFSTESPGLFGVLCVVLSLAMRDLFLPNGDGKRLAR